MTTLAEMARATTVEWLPSEIDLGFAGVSALITATLAVTLVWPLRLIRFALGKTPHSVRFETVAALSSGAAALGAVLGLVFVASGAFFR